MNNLLYIIYNSQLNKNIVFNQPYIGYILLYNYIANAI